MVCLKNFNIILIILILTSCTHNYEISSNIQVNDVEKNYENLYLTPITFDAPRDKNNNIIKCNIYRGMDEENWQIMQENMLKIKYHILKLQSQINQQKNK